MNLDLSKLAVRNTPAGAELSVKVTPGASRSRISGVWGTSLRVAVAALPEGGKANAAVAELLATSLQIPTSQVSLTSGLTSPLKRFLLLNLTASEVLARLAAP